MLIVCAFTFRERTEVGREAGSGGRRVYIGPGQAAAGAGITIDPAVTARAPRSFCTRFEQVFDTSVWRKITRLAQDHKFGALL
jgi:hypothetical protein